jgi:hypothetical protein
MNTPDLTGIRIIHRAMRGDLHRLVRLTDDPTRRAQSVLMALVRPGHRRRQRAVFVSSA